MADNDRPRHHVPNVSSRDCRAARCGTAGAPARARLRAADTMQTHLLHPLLRAASPRVRTETYAPLQYCFPFPLFSYFLMYLVFCFKLFLTQFFNLLYCLVFQVFILLFYLFLSICYTVSKMINYFR